MKARELRIVQTEKPIGTVGLDDRGLPFFDGAAADVLSGARLRAGNDKELVASLLVDGWSNGYLYLAPEGGSGG